MNFLYTTVLILLTLSSCVNSLRWGRIAQREHYIPGYVTKFYFRWVRLVPFNNLYYLTSILLALLSLWTPYTAIVLALINLFLPRGLLFKDRSSKVEFTERLKRLNIVYCILNYFYFSHINKLRIWLFSCTYCKCFLSLCI